LIATRVIERGTVLQGTYEIVRRIGVGGMGEVYEARHTRLPGRFAVKVLSAQVESSGTDFVRFRREAEIASSLRHPHIVQVVDFNQMPDGAPYIVMEYLEGADLAAEIARAGRLSPERTAIIVGQIAAALAAAHAGGIVHRDLKPQNVLVAKVRDAGGDFVKVVDFGISKVRTAATLTDDRKLLGTPQYMAPEQARGLSDDIDSRTDQFALAVMAYEMLTGRNPFAGENVPAVLFAITNDSPASMPEIPAEIAAAVEAALRRAMGKQKGERFTTILEFSDALASAIAGRTFQPPPESGAGGLRSGSDPSAPTMKAAGRAGAVETEPARPSLRRRATVAAIGGITLLAVLGIGVTFPGRRSQEEHARSAVAASPSVAAATSAPPLPVPPAEKPASLSGPPDAGLATAAEEQAEPMTSRRHRATQRAALVPATKRGDDHGKKPAPRPGVFIEDL
jgi:serine/threonine protein kinase